MKKLYCSRVTHTPIYKDDMETEIPENVFQVDGYSLEDMMEGVIFDVTFAEDKVTNVTVGNESDREYFEEVFNKDYWYGRAKEYAERTLGDGDQVEVPDYIKEKYFINGINCAYIR